MDEIGNMSLAFQQKILRVVEYGVFTRVGGSKEHKSEFRLVSATNADLEEKMKKDEFLPDLYDRLTFETITVPPLRERREDISILAQHFLNEFMKEVPTLNGKRLSAESIKILKGYPFPGNIRELKYIIERAAYRDTTDELTPEDLGLGDKSADLSVGSFEQRVEAFQKSVLTDALAKSGGNQAQAARDLEMPYHQFRYYSKKYGL